MSTPAETIERPSLEQLQSELGLLQGELATARRLAAERGERASALQRMQVSQIISTVDPTELTSAALRLDGALAAQSRIPVLESAVTDALQRVDDEQHRQRVAFIRDVEAQYATTYANYKRRSEQTLLAFRELQRLDQQYRALSGNRVLSSLLEPFHRELNLPALTGSLAGRSNFTTGQE